jgi:ABC-type uncharacterized transport system permease subunit
VAELLVWPALLAYGEAAFAYAGNARNPGSLGRFATWGVRLGWLAQTALLVGQAARADGFPWSTWAGSLNLFVWLVVSAYLIWGCKARYRVLGLLVMPPAAALLLVAWAGGGTTDRGRSRYSDLFLALHVGLVLAAFAAFTLAAGLSALYLWQERRLKRREAGILSLRVPSLVALDRLVGRTIAIGLPTLTIGIAVGIARVVRERSGVDALMLATLVTWLLYAVFLALRFGRGWRGRRAAVLALTGFLSVILVHLTLPLTHVS